VWPVVIDKSCDDWGADLRCLCSGGGSELRPGLRERSWSAITGAQARIKQLRTGSEGDTGDVRLGSRRGNQSDGVEGNRRPIRDHTKWGNIGRAEGEEQQGAHC
jgi:hypothetical protein